MLYPESVTSVVAAQEREHLGVFLSELLQLLVAAVPRGLAVAACNRVQQVVIHGKTDSADRGVSTSWYVASLSNVLW